MTMLSRPLALKISSAADLVLLAIFAIESPRATTYSVLSGPCVGEKNAWMFRSPSSCFASALLIESGKLSIRAKRIFSASNRSPDPSWCFACLTQRSPPVHRFEKQPVREKPSPSEDPKCQPRDDEKLHQVIHSADETLNNTFAAEILNIPTSRLLNHFYRKLQQTDLPTLVDATNYGT